MQHIQPEYESPAKKPRLASPVSQLLTTTTVPSVPSKKSTKRMARLARKKERERHAPPEPFSPEDVLWHDIRSVLGKDVVDQAIEQGTDCDSPYVYKQEVRVWIKDISCGGEGLGVAEQEDADSRPWIIVTPFSLPGELVLVSIYRNARMHSLADFVRVLEPNHTLRDDSRVRCRYFTKCGGCQYQMLSYETQLDWKRNVIVRAYDNFSGLPPSSIPPILQTIASPKQYAYRTKLTPHFNAPPKDAAKQLRKIAAEGGEKERSKPEWLNIGFNEAGTRKVMDIEECPIGTEVINDEYKKQREVYTKNILNYKKGVSLLLRDSLVRDDPSSSTTAISETKQLEKHICITDQNATVRERVGDILFEYTAGSFFQNNNSVLEPLTSYVRDAIFPPVTSERSATAALNGTELAPASSPPTHLVDAYCGSGLFALTLTPFFTHISGIELSSQSIASARHNASLNGLLPSSSSSSDHKSITFHTGTASEIFRSVQDYPRAQTAVIIDPPRKGCDEAFLQQLVEFGAAVVVYVSCNVVSQARDVGWILGKDVAVADESAKDGERKKQKYVLESLRGFDLFPQTAHVEGVAVLRLR